MAGYSVTMPNTYVSLPGFDVDAEDVEEQKVQNAMARLDLSMANWPVGYT